MPNTKIERNYLKDMTLASARLWFRYRCQIIDNIKGNKSSMWKHNMACILCTSGGNETQDHLERCSFITVTREDLDLTIRKEKNSTLEEDKKNPKRYIKCEQLGDPERCHNLLD